ncbi:MAG: protease SohB [Pseudomonadales bacterium]
MEYLFQYLTFLAQTATIVVAVLVVVAGLVTLSMRRQQQTAGHLEIRKLNEFYADLKLDVQSAMLPASAMRKMRRKAQKAMDAAAKKAAREAARTGGTASEPSAGRRRTVFVLDFHGDLQANQVRDLRTEISAVLSGAQPGDEVVVRLESPGGMVHGYGLAASQLDRIRQHEIPLTVTVDKVAASGGYLMAAVADRIVAAPFAIVGSIGVVAQVPNVHRLLKRHDVDVDVITAGKFKRTLTVFGENTEEGRRKFVEELDELHQLFQDYIVERRPAIDVEKVATGESWHGQHALSLNLVDELCTSDEYLLRLSDEADIYEVRWVEHRKPLERLMAQVESSMARSTETALGRWVEKLSQWRGGI